MINLKDKCIIKGSSKRMVSLVFDASDNIQDILSILNKKGVQGNFFVNNEWFEKNNQIIMDLNKQGHIIGSSDTNINNLSWQNSILKKIVKQNNTYCYRKVMLEKCFKQDSYTIEPIILNDNYLCMSIMSSIYFISIDFMLICFLIFTIYFTKGSFSNFGKLAIRAMSLYALFEVIIFSINPFHEFVISYIRRDTIIAKYSYQMGVLYWMHLIFTYFMVIVIVVLIIRKIISIPDEYKSQYRIVVSGIIGIVTDVRKRTFSSRT